MTVSPQTTAPVSDTARLREELRANSGLHLREPELALQKAIALCNEAKNSGDRSLLASCQMELGKCYAQCSELGDAGNAFREALRLFTALGDKWNIPKALHALGTMHSATGRLEDALRCFSGALPLVQANKDWFAAQRIFNSWGIVAIRLGDYLTALQCFSECLDLLRDTPDPHLESSVLANLGAIFERSEAYEKALEHFERSLTIARELDDSRQIGNTLIFMANTSAKLGRVDRARAHGDEALAIGRKYHYNDIVSQALISLGELTLKSERPNDALPMLVEAKELLEGSPNSIHYQKVLQALGAAFTLFDRFDEADIVLNRALELATTIGSPQLLYFTYQTLADLASKKHDYQTANEYLMQALKQHELLHNERNQQAVSMLEFQMAMDTYRRTRAEQAQE